MVKIDLKKIIKEETMTTADAVEYLGISRQALNKRVKAEQIVPLIEVTGSLYLRKDVEDLKKILRPKGGKEDE